jgi:uncharacterized protein YjbI with pentapeptide repeats
MGDEQPGPKQPAVVTQAEPPTGNRWGNPITPERTAELRELADRQRAWVDSAPDGQRDLDESVFNGLALTAAEVFWLAAYALAGPEGDLEAAAAQLRDTSGIGRLSRDLSSLHLECASLYGARLQKASLYGAQSQEVDLAGAQLEEA